MWTLILIFLISTLTKFVTSEELILYTHESIREDNSKPCLTGCSPDTHECIINWKREKRSCKILDKPAPIFLTTQYKDTERKHCLSNCGPYDENYEYEWCFTSKDFSKWDYCSTNTRRSFLSTGEQQGKTSSNKPCTDQCSKGRNSYLWCHFNDKNNEQSWETCALSALPRIPVLNDNFQVGQKSKGKCDNFFRYSTGYEQSMFSTSVAVPDHYVTDIAEAIEAMGTNSLSQVYKLNNVNNTITSYAMIKIKDLMVPAIIRAHITKDSINFINNIAATNSEAESKHRQQMSGTTESYEAGTLIGFELGGPNAEYNLVPRSLNWKCDDWADMEESVMKWCQNTGGSVDMLVVIFYVDAETPIPKAFGVSLVFRNEDHSVFVDCRENIYWNNF